MLRIDLMKLRGKEHLLNDVQAENCKKLGENSRDSLYHITL